MKFHALPMGVVALLLLAPSLAHALGSQVQPLDTRADGDYGRMASKWTLSLTGQLELSPQGPAPAARVAAHYSWMAGVYAGLTAPPGGFPSSAGNFGVGVDLRPAFLPRWSLDLERGPSYLDLWLDSFSLGLGVYWQTPQADAIARDRGFEASLGFGFPLFGKAHGLWFDTRGVVRLPDAPSDAQWGGQFGLGWHWGL
jgi:hypothetical protein